MREFSHSLPINNLVDTNFENGKESLLDLDLNEGGTCTAAATSSMVEIPITTMGLSENSVYVQPQILAEHNSNTSILSNPDENSLLKCGHRVKQP